MASKLPAYWQSAKEHLIQTDTKLVPIIDAYPHVELRLKKDSFTTLLRAIVGQQISVKAADTIWMRLKKATDGRDAKIHPHKILYLPPDELRSCGLSQRKIEYSQNLARHFSENKITGRLLARLDDAAVKEKLVALKGIGPWTADMYLMFNLWRPNVLPLGDVGLQRAMEKIYLNGRKSTPQELKSIAAPWAPYSTVAVWYLWRSLDPLPVEY